MNRALWNQYRDYVEANSPEGFMTYVAWLEARTVAQSEKLAALEAELMSAFIADDGEDA